MNLPHRQRGLTLWSAIFVFGTIGFIALCAIKVGPLYMNEASVRRAVSDVAAKVGSGGGEVDVSGIRNALGRRWEIDYIKEPQADQIKVIRTSAGLFLAYDYEARVALFGNITVLAHFAHQYPLRAQPG